MQTTLQDILKRFDQAEEARVRYMVARGQLSRSVSDALTELSGRLRELRYCLIKISRNRFITKETPKPTDCQDTALTDDEELRFYLEAFYHCAYRASELVEYLTGKSAAFRGVSMVRNKLMEHCHDKDLRDKPILVNSISYDEIRGPVLKGMRWADQASENSDFHDEGLFINSGYFLDDFMNRLKFELPAGIEIGNPLSIEGDSF